MNAEIISVGSELMQGDIPNTDAQYLSKRLSGLGIDVIYHTTINDDEKMIRSALVNALPRSQVIIFTGGLGPTPDDLTKETVCSAVGAELVLHEETKSRMESYFARTGRVMSENNLKQAMMPKDAAVFLNDFGTASGCVLSSGNQWIIMLPGPPKELIPMFDHSVIPYLSKINDDINIVIKTISVFGMGESQIAEKLDDFLHYKNPLIATYAADGFVRIKITARGIDKDKCVADCERIASRIAAIIGDNVFSFADETLAEVVVRRLIDKNIKVTTAESCTAGKLSAALTSVPGSSKVIELGITAYSNNVKTKVLGVSDGLIGQYGVYSAEVAGAMAEGAAKVGGTKLGIGITGIAGPNADIGANDPGLVYISLFDGIETYTRKIIVGRGSSEERELVRNMAVLHALDMCRLYLDSKYEKISNIKSENNAGENVDPFLVGSLLSQNKSELADEPSGIDVYSNSRNEDDKPVGFKAKLIRFLKSWFPWKNDSRKEIIRKIALIVFAVIFLVSAGYIADYYIESIRTKKANEGYQDLFNANSDAYLNADGISSRFFELLAINPHTIGWLKVPGTQANNPVVKSDNSYYLNHDFEGNVNKHGTLFLDQNAVLNRYKKSRNLVIYGHHMKDGTMFGELKKYRADKSSGLDFYKENPTIEFASIYQIKTTKWKIFSVFVTNTLPEHDNGDVYQYWSSDFSSDEDFNAFIEQALSRSMINTTVDITEGDNILTLSTCIYDFSEARLVVMAREVRDGETETVDVQSATRNTNAKFPAAYYGKTQPASSQAASSKNPSSSLAPSTISEVSSRQPVDISSLPAISSQPGTSSSPSSYTEPSETSQSPSSQPDVSSDTSSEAPSEVSEGPSSEGSSQTASSSEPDSEPASSEPEQSSEPSQVSSTEESEPTE